MAKKEKHQHHPQKQETKTVSKEGLLLRIDSWFEKHEKKVFYFLLFLSTLFSFLLFDSKVSEGGDDSSYIERAWLFLNEGRFPYYQGPGYPLFLSVLIKVFGMNVIILKLFSVLCQIGFVWFTYKAFRKRIPFTVLFALISFIALNHFIQYYSSQTFTETFFLFIQAICFYVLFKIIDAINKNDSWKESFRKNYLKWLSFAFILLLLSISKSIAIVCLAGILLYFLINKNYKEAVYAVVAFAVLRIVYQLVVTQFYGAPESGQFEQILRKNLYQPNGGHEDFAGLVQRFFDNFNTYISLHMYRIMNINNAAKPMINPALSYISALILTILTFISYKRNRYVFFSSIYMIILCCGIFVGIQAANMQDRLIIIVMPMIFLVLFYGMYELVKRSSITQTLFILFAAFMLVFTTGKSIGKAQKNIVAIKKNLSGDIYYGYTPDWENFLKMSKYCADSLPDSAGVLSRKPSMSFIYGDGKRFVGQFWVTTMNADSVLMEWKSRDVDYILLPSLRKDPSKNDGMIINTIHRMLGPVYEKYPQKIKLVKKIGTIEACELYEIKY